MGPWLTESAALQTVADLLKQPVESLAADGYWKRMSAAALQMSQADIAGVLRARAFTAAQLDAMKDAERLGLATSQFLWRMCKLGTGLADFVQGAADALDMREFLAGQFAVPDASGDAAVPAGTAVGGIAAGLSTAGDAIIAAQVATHGSRFDSLNAGY